MKRILPFLLAALLLAGCGTTQNTVPSTLPRDEGIAVPAELLEQAVTITLSDDGVTGEGISLSNDIIYYEDKDAYESGNPYGEGEAHERHSAAEAAAHTVVNITAPGVYRVTGKLSKGQIRIDLGEDAYDDPQAVVHLILDGADITCTVAPAILFLNVYECDGDWSADTAKAEVDTSAAGANLYLMDGTENMVHGSHVAKIFKDKDGEKKLWKQDGAIYSYMSMNVSGKGSLELYADNEGLDTELHLTIHSGNIVIRSDNDGINTNEDGVSVTTINGGNLHIIAGLGAEGDGIDSNGYLVINGGTVVACANPAADAGLDSDLGSFVNGGTVVALGSTMDWAESDSGQVTMNLQFAAYQNGGITVTREDGTTVFSYDPRSDAILGSDARQYQGTILSCPDLTQGEGYYVYMDGVRQAYTGTDVRMAPGGFGGGQRPQSGFDKEPPEMPDNAPPDGIPDTPPPDMPDNAPPEGIPEGQTPPQGFGGEMPGGDRTGANTLFFMGDMVNCFSGIAAAE